MKFHETPLAGAFIIEMEMLRDERGAFARTFCKREFQQHIGHTKEFVQFNYSETRHTGTIRGMHYQLPPNSEIKLLRCIKGRVFDVIIDLRAGSPTFLQWYGEELSEDNGKMMYVPEGFAHGFQTLTDDCRLIYHHTAFYAPQYERGVRFDDPVVNIQWPLPVTIISQKDASYPLLTSDFKGIAL